MISLKQQAKGQALFCRRMLAVVYKQGRNAVDFLIRRQPVGGAFEVRGVAKQILSCSDWG